MKFTLSPDNLPDRIEIARAIEKELKYKRYLHTMGVAFTASSLAMRHGGDVRRAELAGFLHDCAKYMDEKRMTELCRREGMKLSEVEIDNGALLHSKAGSILARTRYGVKDEELLSAIRYHTTGRPGMTLLEKIVFVADYIESGRDIAPRLPEIRREAFNDLDSCVRMILEDTLSYLTVKGDPVDPMTRKTLDFYLKEKEGQILRSVPERCADSLRTAVAGRRL